MNRNYPGLLRASEIVRNTKSFSHPFNSNSEIIYTQLALKAGLKRTGVNVFRVPPGKDSLVYHSHQFEEEWFYILAGRGKAHVDGAEYEIGPGDFLGFPAPSVAHNISNPFDEELVYLSGGEHHEFEVADFPEVGKRMVRIGDSMRMYGQDEGQDFLENE